MSSTEHKSCPQEILTGAGEMAVEMAQWLRAPTAPLKVMSSNPSNHMMVHNHLYGDTNKESMGWSEQEKGKGDKRNPDHLAHLCKVSVNICHYIFSDFSKCASIIFRNCTCSYIWNMEIQISSTAYISHEFCI